MSRLQLAVALTSLSLSAAAAPVYSTTAFSSFRKVSELNNTQFLCNNAGGTSVACSGTGALRDIPTLDMTYDARAHSAPGVLKARASASLRGTGAEAVDSLTVIRADAILRDQIVFSGLPAGTPGSVVFSFALSGAIWGSDLVHLNPNTPFADTNGAAWALIGRRYVNGTLNKLVSVSEYIVLPVVNLEVPVIFGQTEDISLALMALVNMRYLVDGSNATSDFSSTASLVGMSAYDLSRRLVPNFYATGSGDSSYLDVGPAIPEPGTWTLAALGLLALAARIRRS